MAPESRQQEVALAAAEEILHLVYGDDLAGCTTSLDAIAAVVLDALKTEAVLTTAVLDLYEQSNTAVATLCRPPRTSDIDSPAQLQSLLSERLDRIRALTQKVADLATAAKSAGQPPE